MNRKNDMNIPTEILAQLPKPKPEPKRPRRGCAIHDNGKHRWKLVRSRKVGYWFFNEFECGCGETMVQD